MDIHSCYSSEFNEFQYNFTLIGWQPAAPGPSQDCIDQIVSSPNGIQEAIDRLEDLLILKYRVEALTALVSTDLQDCNSASGFSGVVATYYESTCTARCLSGTVFDFSWEETTCEGSACCVTRSGYCLDNGVAVFSIVNTSLAAEGVGCNTVDAPCFISLENDGVNIGFGKCRPKGRPCQD